MSGIVIKKEDVKRFNQLAREQMKLKLLADIRMDLMICKIEGWDITEYLKEINDLVRDFIKDKRHLDKTVV